MLATCWQYGFTPKWLGKHTLFKAPSGSLMRALGGIPVNRANPGKLVEALVAQVRAGNRIILGVAPEGTGQHRTHWKSGFHRIARDADLPVVWCYVDSATRTTDPGPTITLSGDIGADMDQIRAFYADKNGIHPQNYTPPGLREEDAQPEHQ